MNTYTSLWDNPIEQWLAWLTSGDVREETWKLRRYQLSRFAHDHRTSDPWDLTVDDLATWMASHQWGSESLRSYRAALRSYYGWAHATGRTTEDPSRLLRKIKPKRAVPRPVSETVIDDALHAADDRDWLILMLGSRQGMRRGEIALVHSRDLIDEGDGVWSLLVHGKGGKDRVLPLLPPIASALRRLPRGWAFPNGKGTHITPPHVGVLARRAMERAASTHQLRHRFATVTYRKTHDIRAVQELLGHASVATTQIYTAVDTATLRSVMQTAA